MEYQDVLTTFVGPTRVQEIMAHYPTPQALISGGVDMLKLPKNMKKTLLSAIELAKLAIAPRPEKTLIRTSSDAYEIMKFLQFKDHEEFWILLLDTKHKLSREPVCVVSGGLTTCSVLPREVFAPVLVASSSAALVVHNHPSGDPTPSCDDLALTARLKQAAAVLGIKLLDHIIIGEGRYTSLVDEGHFTSL